MQAAHRVALLRITRWNDGAFRRWRYRVVLDLKRASLEPCSPHSNSHSRAHSQGLRRFGKPDESGLKASRRVQLAIAARFLRKTNLHSSWKVYLRTLERKTSVFAHGTEDGLRELVIELYPARAYCRQRVSQHWFRDSLILERSDLLTYRTI